MLIIPDGLRGLISWAQWILWKPVAKQNGHTDKVPCGPLGDVIDPHLQSNRMTAEQALKAQNKLGAPFGVGFVFTAEDPFFFVDVDGCLEGNRWNSRAEEMIAVFQGAAMMTSSSGEGLHIIGSSGPPGPHGCRNEKAGLELYTEKRFVALSLNPAVGDCLADCSAVLGWLIPKYFAKGGAEIGAGWTAEPVAEWTGTNDDDELIEKALGTVSAPAAFGGVASFRQLWEADGAALAGFYPDPNREYNESSADSALATHLAFWTGKNCERIARLMWKSALARDKWETHNSYLERTILGAVAIQKSVYDRVALPPPPPPPAGGYFPGCVYIAEMHRILMPNGMLLKPDVFKAVHGGPLYPLGYGKTTKNAFAAATESSEAPIKKVDRMLFRPLMAPGAVVVAHGCTAVNTFVPNYGPGIEGDVGPFLGHIAAMIPLESDREIFLSYMAACIQLVGIKFQWAPVIQGVQGNGKTFIYKILEYALGEQYCFQLNGNDVENKFTGWITNKLLICIEELRVQGRVTIADFLKPMITNERVSVQHKGLDQTTGDNFANFMIFSNHKDAVLKMRDDRRYAIFYTAHQSVEDLTRDGMGDGYFKELYKWLKNGGAAYAVHYLQNRPINVNVLGRAPATSSTDEAHVASMGPVEQLLMEGVESEAPGFKADMIEFGAAFLYLRSMGRGVAPRTLANALHSIGYIKPAIFDGKYDRIMVEGARCRIYAKRGSEAAKVSSNDALREIWEK